MCKIWTIPKDLSLITENFPIYFVLRLSERMVGGVGNSNFEQNNELNRNLFYEKKLRPRGKQTDEQKGVTLQISGELYSI